MPDTAHKQALPIGFELHEYRIDAVLGVGAFGITYRAFDTRLSLDVAIKEFLPVELVGRDAGNTLAPHSAADGEAFRWGLRRFLDEAKTLGRFKHPNIVRVLRYLEANGSAYLVMDYEAGQSLGQYLRDHGPTLDQQTLLAIFLPILDGLRAVHEAGLLHRDIKPDNIYLRDDATPILIDFGAARQAVGEKSRSVTSVLTPGYAPLEQYSTRGKQGPWTDLYAVGAAMHRCISGQHPPEANDRRMSQDEGEPDPLTPAATIGAGRYDPELLACIDQALRLLPKDRPQAVRLTLTGVDYSGGADVLFEDRKVIVRSGVIEEPIDAYGTRAYALPVGPLPEDDLKVDPKNLTVNPSYEWQPSVGTPAGCYAGIPPGATFAVDSRVARHGRHSLRLRAPTDDAKPSISPFPVSLQAGKQYRVSLWAKAVTEGLKLNVSLGKLGSKLCELTTQWTEYSFTVTPEADLRRAGASIGLNSAGVAWVDLFQIVPVEE